MKNTSPRLLGFFSFVFHHRSALHLFNCRIHSFIFFTPGENITDRHFQTAVKRCRLCQACWRQRQAKDSASYFPGKMSLKIVRLLSLLLPPRGLQVALSRSTTCVCSSENQISVKFRNIIWCTFWERKQLTVSQLRWQHHMKNVSQQDVIFILQ